MLACLSAFTLQAADVSYELVTADYQTIVDTVNAWGTNTHSNATQEDDYFGASAKYSNFSGYSYNTTDFATQQEAIDSAMKVALLPALYPSAAVDDTYTLTYAIYSGDAATTRSYVCTAAGAIPTFALSKTAADITAATVDNQVGDAIIDADNYTVTIKMLIGSDLSSLKPVFSISDGASISDTTQAYDFSSSSHTYTVTAEAGNSQDWALTIEEVSIYSIAALQATSDDAADMVGVPVAFRGVVSATSSSSFYVQDASGPWNGMYVYKYSHGTSIGDSVELSGTLTEYYNLTEFVPDDLTILASDKNVPDAYTVTSALDESLESVLVTLEDVTFTSDDDSGDSKAWLIADKDGTEFKVYGTLYNGFTPLADSSYDITGVVTYTYSNFRICPRSEEDIVANFSLEESAEINIAMNSDYYQIIVDSVANYNSSYVDSYGTAESYFGASAYHSNFDIATDGSWDMDAFSSWEEAVQTALSSYLLPALYPNAIIDDTSYTVSFATYDGSDSGTGSFTFVCSKAAPDPEFTLMSTAILNEGFEEGLNNWTQQLVTGTVDWYASSYDVYQGDSAAYISGYNNDVEAWLISPSVDLTQLTAPAFTFYSQYKYSGPDMTVKYSTDYDGSSAPGAATWTDVDFTLPSDALSWTFSGNIDLDAIKAETEVYFAFIYTSTSEGSGYAKNWWIDNVSVDEYTPFTEANILDVVVDNQVGDATIDEENYAVSIYMAVGSDLTSLKPTFSISSGASISDTTLAYDFSSSAQTYTVTAEAGNTQDWTVSIAEISATAIANVQATDATGDTSIMYGQSTIIRGVVTGFFYNSNYGYNGYFVQDADGLWNGIYVYDKYLVGTVSSGDSVEIVGTVDEYYGYTEFIPTTVTVLATRKSLPTPYEPTAALEESCEGVYLSLPGATLAEDTDAEDSKAWLVATYNGVEYKLYDQFEVGDFTPESGKTYDIKGLGYFTYDHFRITPRSTSDLAFSTAVAEVADNNLQVYPNPCSDVLNVSAELGSAVQIVNAIGRVQKSFVLNQSSVDVSDLNAGIYFLIANGNVSRFVKQ